MVSIVARPEDVPNVSLGSTAARKKSEIKLHRIIYGSETWTVRKIDQNETDRHEENVYIYGVLFCLAEKES
jgi:hypothetical protein